MPDAVSRLNAALEGRYAIERELGEGGMATVYLADDLKHERKVALKVLKPELAAVVGAERFLTEIKTTANLQHPHILPLFDSGEADTFLFYVMPYVEGESLRERLEREKQLPVDEAVRIATAVANALQTAHEQGIIHRDIKPANILLRRGEPLIADFGIALAVGAAGSNRLTETGLSLGTPYYMSPEQATGDQFVGPSTDTYALGSVLYEMLVGDPPYPGSTAQAVLGKIIAGKPVSAMEHRPSTPANVDAAVRKALEKLPADRFRSAQDFVRALGDEHFRYGEAVVGVVDADSGPWKRLSIGLAALAAVSTAVAGWALLRPEPPKLVQRFSLALSEGQAPIEWLSLSPDGSAMVSAYPNEDGEMQLWLRRFDGELAPTPIPGTEREAWDPIISPTGEEVAFVQDGRLKVARLQGGLIRVLADSVNCCMRWGPDEFIYYQNARQGISRVPVTSVGGVGEPVIQREESDGDLGYFQVLPGGEVAVFTVWGDTTRIEAMRLDTRERKILVAGGMRPYVTPTGHLVFGTAEGQILAAPFDSEALELTGPEVPLIDGVYLRGVTDPSFSLSESGTLAYWLSPQGTALDLTPMWVERGGAAREIDPRWRVQGDGTYSSLALSPDGIRLAISILDSEGRYDLWVKQLDNGPLSPLTVEGRINYHATWSRDGQSVTFASNRAGNVDLWAKRADGSGTVELVLDRELGIHEALYSNSPDGTRLVFREGSVTFGGGDLYAIPPGDSVPVPLVATDFSEYSPALSPNGRWLAYVSNRSGENEIYVSPFPDAGSGQVPVSTDGGTEPLWAHSGRELFYRNGANELVAVQVTENPTFAAGQQDVLFSMTDYLFGLGYHPQYDVSPDDQRFVMLRIDGEVGGSELILVQNFFEELRERVGN